MKWQVNTPRKRLFLIGALILLGGLGSAVLIYLTADDARANDSIYAFEHSKKYVHDMQVYGGQMNVLADRLSRWLDGLWEGTSLAYTVACLSVFVSAGFCFVASRLPSGPGFAGRDEAQTPATK